MRITNNTMSNNYLSSLNKTLEKESKAQQLLSGDGRALHSPSDDPVKVVRSLRFSTSLALNNQYTQNAKDAQSWMNNSDGAMQDLDSIMINIKEKVSQASTGSNPQEAVQTIGTYVDNLINQMINIGNSQLGGRYIFAGQNDKTVPFTRNGDIITYSGDDQKISMPIAPGIANPSQDSVNLTGQDVFGPNLKTLTDLVEIKNHLMAGTKADMEWLSNTGLTNLDVDQDQMLQSHTTLGSRMSMYEMANNVLDNANTIIQEDQANNDDVDIAKALIDFTNAQNVYETALKTGAKILPMSLVNFL